MKVIAGRIGRLEREGSRGPRGFEFWGCVDGLCTSMSSGEMLLALHRGKYRDGESIAEAYARAIGFSEFSEYKRLVAQDKGEWLRRHKTAWDELCAEYGLHVDLTAGEQVKILADLLEDAPDHITNALYREAAGRASQPGSV